MNSKWSFPAPARFTRFLTVNVAQASFAFFRKNFDREGFSQKRFKSWKERKVYKSGKLLVDTGKLRDSLKIDSMRFGDIKLSYHATYAGFHDDGTDRMPARPLLYQSDVLDRQIGKVIRTEFKQFLKIKR